MSIKSKIAFLFFACCFCGIQKVSAEDTIKPIITGGFSLSQNSMELIIRDRKFTPSFTSLGLAINASHNNFYISLNHDQSIKNEIEPDPNGLIFYSRHDTSLALSYGFQNQVTLSMGYRSGETESFFSASNNSFGTTEEGFFIAGNYAYILGTKSTLSTNVAIAQLDGEVSLREPFVDTSAFVVGPPPPTNILGEALGFSASIRWTGSISDKTQYSVGLKLHRYEFEDKEVFGGLDLSYEQNFTIFSLSMAHKF